jgi:hypothetical protein
MSFLEELRKDLIKVIFKKKFLRYRNYIMGFFLTPVPFVYYYYERPLLTEAH